MCNLYDKTNHAIHIKSLKQAIEHGLILDKVHTQGNWVQSRSLIEFLHMYEHRTENKGQK